MEKIFSTYVSSTDRDFSGDHEITCRNREGNLVPGLLDIGKMSMQELQNHPGEKGMVVYMSEQEYQGYQELQRMLRKNS